MRLPTMLFAIALTASSVWCSRNAIAQGPATRARDERAIRDAGKAYLAALRQGDVKVMAECWTAEGDYIDAAGQKVKARELFAQRSEQGGAPVDKIASSGAASTTPKDVTSTSIRFISSDVAVEDGSIAVTGENRTGGCFTAVWVKQEGRWRLDCLREAATAPGNDATALSDLDWLVGNWTAESDGTTMHESFSWGDNRRFLLGRFSVRSPDGVTVTASQRIGWDPSARQLKSWFFDSEGGFGEGEWVPNGKQWTLRTTQTLPDGSKAVSTVAYARDGDDAFVWKSTDAATGKDRSVRFSRQPAGE